MCDSSSDSIKKTQGLDVPVASLFQDLHKQRLPETTAEVAYTNIDINSPIDSVKDSYVLNFTIT